MGPIGQIFKRIIQPGLKSQVEVYKKVYMEYGCIMLYVQSILNLECNKEDLYFSKEEGIDGLETEPHITLFYGLENVPKNKIIKFIKNNDFKFQKLILGKTHIFDNEKYDVLVFKIIDNDDRELNKINKLICEFPHKKFFRDYNPHLTIGYFKKGMALKYKEIIDRVVLPQKIMSDKIVYSIAHKKYEIKNFILAPANHMQL